MRNQLLNLLENSEEATVSTFQRYIEYDKKMLFNYGVTKNIPAEEHLNIDFDNLPLINKNKCLAELKPLFERYLSKNKIEYINRCLLVHNENRRGLDENYLFSLLEDEKLGEEIKIIIAQHLSNFSLPDIETWKKLINKNQNSFLLIPIINKAKLVDPCFAITIFKKIKIDADQYNKLYIPLKRVLISIFQKASISETNTVIKTVKHIIRKKESVKIDLLNSLFASEELISYRSLVFSEQKVSIYTKAIETDKKLNSIKESDFDQKIPQIPFLSLLLFVINNFTDDTKDRNNIILSFILNLLESTNGSFLHASLSDYGIRYDSLNENVTTKYSTIELETTFNSAKRKMRSIKSITNNNRLEIIQNAII